MRFEIPASLTKKTIGKTCENHNGKGVSQNTFFYYDNRCYPAGTISVCYRNGILCQIIKYEPLNISDHNTDMKMNLSGNILFILVFIAALSAKAQITDNAEIKQMFDDDQNSRISGEIDWTTLAIQDSLRLMRVFELTSQGKVQTANDYYRTAMICQHGWDTISSAMAVKHMEKAIELDTTMDRWLLAAAIDRDLMYRGKPQIFGTQYVKKGPNAKFLRYDMDTTIISDEMRKLHHVETLAEQRHKEWKLNLGSILEFYQTSNDIQKTLKLIKSESKRGYNAVYNVDEYEINMLGDKLLEMGKPTEALEVYRLNTMLYPKSDYLFDIYGHCLLQLNKKKQAKKAYRRALAINPDNENARKMLADLD